LGSKQEQVLWARAQERVGGTAKQTLPGQGGFFASPLGGHEMRHLNGIENSKEKALRGVGSCKGKRRTMPSKKKTSPLKKRREQEKEEKNIETCNYFQ